MPVETTENYVRIRIKNPDNFQDGSFKTINISANEGINAIIGRLKGETSTTIQAYLFDVDKWNETTAKAWVEKHKTKAERTLYEIISPIQFEQVKLGKFLKEVITEGEWTHPQDPAKKFQVTKERMLEWVKNFKNKVLDIVPAPLGHSDNPIDNAGIIEDLYVAASPTNSSRMSLFAKFNILLEDIVQKIGQTIRGNSIAIEQNFMDTKTGENLGEVLVHIALTNNPHIQGLADFTSTFSKEYEKVEFFIPNQEIRNMIEIDFAEMSMEEMHVKIKEMKKMMESGNMSDSEKTAMKEKIQKMEEKMKSMMTRGGESKMDEKELKALEEKIGTTFEKKISDVVTCFEKKLSEKDEKIIQLEKRNLESDITSKVDGLIREGKLIIAERENTIKFGMENKTAFDMYFVQKSKEPVRTKVELGQVTRTRVVDNSEVNIPTQTQLKKINENFLTRRGAKMGFFDTHEFNEQLKNWKVNFEKCGKQFIVDGISFVDGIRLNKNNNPEVKLCSIFGKETIQL